MPDRTTHLDDLAQDDAHKLGARLAAEVMDSRGEMSYDGPVAIYVEGVGTYTLTIDEDHDGDLFDGNHGDFGTLAEPSRSRHHDTGRMQRPSGFDGAARKLDTRRGPIWWQPPADEKGNAQLAERVRRWFAEDWSFVGVTLTLSIPGYEDQSTSLWGIETDGGADYLAETITDISGDLDDGPAQERQTMATKLRRWVSVFEGAYEEDSVPQDVRDACTDMLDAARQLDPKVVA